MDLFKDIKKGKFGKNKALRREAEHEIEELGGAVMAEKFEKHIKSLKGGSKSKALERMKHAKVGEGRSHYTGKIYKHE